MNKSLNLDSVGHLLSAVRPLSFLQNSPCDRVSNLVPTVNDVEDVVFNHTVPFRGTFLPFGSLNSVACILGMKICACVCALSPAWQEETIFGGFS